MSLYRKPDGEVTSDIQEYGKAWRELITEVEKHFPGYQCSGYDPDIQMVPVNSKPWRNVSFGLPVAAAYSLIYKKEP